MSDLSIINGVGNVQPVGLRPSATQAASPKGFGNILEQALGDVSQMPLQADQAAADLVAGKSQDVHNTMIAIQKADIGFQMLMQVRNKVVSAYETIMRMQI
ncbi:MAG: flagellar hook-basal body complex protein FliE [Desulfosarcina sp.]|nr:flagellar hook-basal body complex protein FliE [Desulfobacterales bacterium]